MNRKEISRRHYLKNKANIIKRANRWNRDHDYVYQKNWRRRNASMVNHRRRSWFNNVRTRIIGHYSDGKFQCACCGWTPSDGSIKMLEVDHIDGGGGRLAKTKGLTGTKFSMWLWTNNFPEGFRILDAGCNRMMKAGAKKCALHGGPIP